MVQNKNRKWYANGLRFTCTRCGTCCKARGEYVYVYVSDECLEKMARIHGLHPIQFERRYCTFLEGERIFKFEEELCPMNDGTQCTVYRARPIQCRTWPFWPENIESEKSWEEKVLKVCPGTGKGRLWTPKEIDFLSSAMEAEDNGRETPPLDSFPE